MSGKGTAVDREVRESVSEEMTFEQRYSGKSILSKGNGMCKGAEAGLCLVCLKTLVQLKLREWWEGSRRWSPVSQSVLVWKSCPHIRW